MDIATLRPNQLPTGKESFSLTAEAISAACERLGISQLHQYQWEVLESLSQGKDALVCAPTGAGKSICFILPTLLSKKPTLIVSPLISLIRSQQKQLAELGIRGTLFDSLQSSEDRDQAWQDIERGESLFIWASPERLARPSFRERLGEIDIGLVAIDEAHCISQWGYHFRPEYRKIALYLNDLPRAPRIALTATATDATRTAIIDSIGLRSPKFALDCPVRANLDLQVQKCRSSDEQLQLATSLALSEAGTVIIYAPTRKKVEEIYRLLSPGARSIYKFHGGLGGENRRETINAFLKGDSPIMVATSSFGMGIDRRDIRAIIHIGLCQSVEQYTQEIGRAGRDGQKAICSLLYGPKDFFLQRFLLSRTFPDAHFLFECYALAKSILENRRWVNRYWLEQELRTQIPWGHDKSFKPDHGVATDVLAREGLLLDLSQRGEAGDESLLTGGSEAKDDFWEKYQETRTQAITNLRSMLAFAKLGEGHNQFLEDYFRK